MGYRNKVFVSFDGDSDIHYYRLMCAWKQSDNMTFNFFDAHDIAQARDSSTETTIRTSLRTRLMNSKVFVVLVGEQTRYLYKYVRWEMEQAVSLALPIIAVNLNGLKYRDDNRCPPIIRDELALHIGFKARILQYALEGWPQLVPELRAQGKTGPHYYQNDVYERLGL